MLKDNMEEGKCVTSNDKYSIYQKKKKILMTNIVCQKIYLKKMLKLCNIQRNA